jgi:hypothetical protein
LARSAAWPAWQPAALSWRAPRRRACLDAGDSAGQVFPQARLDYWLPRRWRHPQPRHRAVPGERHRRKRKRAGRRDCRAGVRSAWDRVTRQMRLVKRLREV